jgi:hypothetical protein
MLGPQASQPAHCHTEGLDGNQAGEDACAFSTMKL